MKMILRNIGLILLLVSPLFSALLTDDLEVVSPTGMPFYHDYNKPGVYTPNSSYTITFRFIETSMGVLLVREHSRGGVSQLSRPVENSKTSLVIFKSSSGQDSEGGIKKMNVILE